MLTHWQLLLKEVVTSPIELLTQLNLDADLLPAAQQAAKLFPLRVPQGFISRMKKGDPDDPLLRQVLPLAEEALESPDFTQDPLNESAVNPIPGLLHKYYGRVLITLVGACAINCRYCFRRHFPYQKNIPGKAAWKNIVAYLANNNTIFEVILSGGDPLLAQDEYLKACIHDLASIPHLKILRIHSRLPIVLPQRITLNLLEVLTSTTLQPVMVVHCNHSNELDDSVSAAIALLQEKKIIVFNQSVLLKGVNDSVEALVHLSQRLVAIGIVPYYLHLLDKVQGAAHFAVDEIKAGQLIAGMQNRIAGYLVPKLVKEEAGATAKQSIAMVTLP